MSEQEPKFIVVVGSSKNGKERFVTPEMWIVEDKQQAKLHYDEEDADHTQRMIIGRLRAEETEGWVSVMTDEVLVTPAEVEDDDGEDEDDMEDDEEEEDEEDDK